MPGFDGTGPTGAGSRTGRGMGPCGTGSGFDGGCGWRARMGLGGFKSPKNQQQALQADQKDLETQLEIVKAELEAVKKEANK